MIFLYEFSGCYTPPLSSRNNNASNALHFLEPSPEGCLRVSVNNFGLIPLLLLHTAVFYVHYFELHFLFTDSTTTREHGLTLLHIAFFLVFSNFVFIFSLYCCVLIIYLFSSFPPFHSKL